MDDFVECNVVDDSVLDKELNPEQAAAAKKINGPMLILLLTWFRTTRLIPIACWQ